MDYDLELNKAVELVKQNNAKIVCIQLPDGIKDQAKKIADHIKENTDADVIIWADTCFGGCDVALDSERLGADLIIQWGHTEWIYKV